jgi:hypothetical protein
MAVSAFNKFNDFSQQVIKGVHHFATDVYKVCLTNVAPIASQTTLDLVSAHAPPTSAVGYPTGGSATTITLSVSSGVTSVLGTQVVFTATGGSIGPFRYAVLYNDTATSPADAVVGWYDYGTSITLGDTETVTIQFNSATPGTILTLT